MEKNITNSHSQNRDGNSNKNNQNLDSNNVEFIEYFNIAFKYKGKRSIKNAKNNTLLKILLPIIIFAILFTIGIIMLINFKFTYASFLINTNIHFIILKENLLVTIRIPIFIIKYAIINCMIIYNLCVFVYKI
jgi:hypothetical protein